LLWERLRGSRLGVAFRRQVVVADCIVDFAAPAVRLVVEVDGGYHVDRQRADARRDRVLQELGWRVLRLSAATVEQDIAVAVGLVAQAVAAG
jgi:very-short-patch-repair endonuclease